MKKTSTLSLLKHLSFFLTVFFCSLNSSGQTTGPFIPYVRAYPDASKGDSPIIRGNMVIISNSILGVDDNTFDPNDDYNNEVSSSAQTRAYIDIDSDPDRDTKYQDNGVPIFQNLVPSESEYAGIPGTLSADGSTLSNGEPILDDFGSPNYGRWVDGSPSLTGPFLPGIENGTFSSSSADLKINSSNNSCSEIKRAYLYWAGLYTGEQFIRAGNGGTGNFSAVTRNRPDCIDANGQPCELYTDIKILPPRASEYVDIKFNNSGADENTLKTEILYDDTWSRDLGVAHSVYNKLSTVHPTAGFNSISQNQGWQGHPSYACRADITSLMQSIENTGESVEGFWTVANIRSTVGRKNWGLAAGWTIVVVYEDPLESQKYITLFDGYVNVNNGQETTTITGFETVPVGPVNVEFASLSIEGDARLLGDNFRINGTNVSATKPAGVVSDIGYDNTNYFDSSILSIDHSTDNLNNLRRFPNSLVNLGFDADHFLLDNSGNSIIANGDTSANVIVTAPGNDQTSTYFTAFSVEVIAPDLVVTKQTFREDGTPIEIGNDIVDLGDKIVYEIIIENVGNEEAVYTQFQDLIPINTIFNFSDSNFSFNNVPISLTDSNLAITTNDSGEVDSDGNPISTTLITYNIQDSVNSAGVFDGNNGLLEPGESVEITFTVQVVTDCSFLRNACSGFIENQADVTYSALIDGSQFQIQSAFEVDACDIPDPAPTPFLADQAQCFITAEPISQCQEFIVLDAGLGFDEYIWSFDDGSGAVPFNIDANGDATLNQDSVLVNTSGIYSVNEILTSRNDCQDIFLTFDVEALDAFNPGIDPYDNINPDFVIANGACVDTNVSEITTILLCEGPQIIGAGTFPLNTTFSWQELNTNPGCTATSSDCPFVNSNGSSCYTEFSTSNTFEFTDAGDYLLTITLDGGCPFDFYFTTVRFDVNPLLVISSGGACAGPAELEVTNIPANYTVEFTDASGAILQADSPMTTYTLNPPANFSNVVVTATVTPDVANYDGCTFSDDLVVSFSNLSQTTLTTDQPTCFQDQDTTDGIDSSKGQIFIQVDGAINYTYELENTTTSAIDLVPSTTSNNHQFENVDPGTYELRVFSDNYPISGETTPASCLLTETIIIEEFSRFDVDVDLVQLTCQPAQVDFELDSDETTPDYSLFTTRFVLPNGDTRSFSGQIGSILIADIINTPNTGEVDDVGNILPDDGIEDIVADVYLQDLYTNGATLTLEVFKTGTGSCSIERTITINPFTPLTLEVTSPREPSCRNDANGQVNISPVAGSDNISDITGYEITAADDVSQIGRTTSVGGIFNNLTAGEYTFTASQDINGTSCTAEITFTLNEPEAITTPVIVVEQDYTCETNEGHINLQPGLTISGGTTPYTYRLLKYTESTLTNLIDTREVRNVSRLPYESLTDGFYVLEIEDRKNCKSELSNVITFLPLSDVTLTLDNSPLLTCNATTTTITVSATATNGGIIEGYSIVNVTDPSAPTVATDHSLNTTGDFDLEPGDYEITSRTSSTLCVSNVLELTIDPVVNITGTRIGGRETLTCISANDGSTSYSLSGIGANGYSYTITKDAVAFTPAATNPQPSTNLTATAFLLENLETGAYQITFTDDFTNCTDVVSFSISNPPAIVLTEAIVPQYNCSATGLGTYTFQVSAVGGTGTVSFSDGTTTSATGEFTINATAAAQTITVTATDGNTCTQNIDIDIPATDTLLVTSPITQCIENGINDVVTVTFSGATGNIQYKEDGAATFTTATIVGSTFNIDTNKTIGGTYTYLIVDDNNNESCARELEVTFYDDIDISNLSTTTLNCDATSGAVPAAGASITFQVNGGTGAYTYTYETSGTTNVAAGTTLPIDAGSTDANPTFSFDDSFDEQLITITIANVSGCGVPTTITYTPNYPEVPTVDIINVPPFVCNNETLEVEITPTFEAGETINSFTYIFDGVEQLSNSNQYTEGTTTFTYAIRRTSTGCISTTENGTLNSVDPIEVGTIVTTPEICMPFTKGTANFPIINGSGTFDVTVTNLDDASLAPYFLDDVSSPISFPSLEIGNHLVEITDSNGCILQDRVEFRIIPEPNVQFRNEAIVTDCINKVTYFFEIEDGIGPFDIGLSLTTLIDPTLFGDDISNFNDPEFDSTLFATVDAGPFDATTNPLGVLNYNRVYSYTRLEFDQAYTVFVQDTNTLCFSSADVDAQDSEDLIITLGTPINTGTCALNTGEIPFSFDLTTTGLTQVGQNYVAEIIEVDGTIDTSVTPVTITNVTATGNTGTLVGLPAGSHILRIRPEITSNECSATANFLIGTEPAMGPLEIAFSRGASCSEAAQLELRVSGGGGRMPYEYLLMPTGNTPDDSTIFTETATISETTILSFTDATGALIADAFVKDASGCISNALIIDIPALIEPTLTLAPSPEDCDDTGLFTTVYTIGNYDDTKSYTFTVNGDVPGNAQITITDPDALGAGTVSAQNRDTYTIAVTASDNPACPATATFELAEDVINIQATLDDPDCDGNLDFITVEVVNGGFVGIPTRQLVYQVYTGATVPALGTGTPIATITPSPIETTFTFNAGTDYGNGALSLVANTDYSVRVIDIYDAADPTGRQCNDVHEGLRMEPVILPGPVTVAETELSCSTANDGQIELGITGTSANIDYRLFQFANASDAQAAIASDTVVLSGTEIASNILFTEGNIFSNLQGVSNAAYVGVVNVTSLSCPIFSTVIDLDEPDNTPASAFVIAGIDGNCDNTDLVADVLPQVTIQIAGILPSAITDYEITISPSVGSLTNPFTFADLALVASTTDTYTIDANSVPSQTYTVSITDVNTTCAPIEYTQTVNCDTELDQLGVVVTSPAIACFDITNTSTVTFEVTAANGNPLLFDYTVTTKNDPSTILDSGIDVSASPVTIAVGLLTDEYILNIKDKNETRIPPVISEFEVTMPDSSPDFSLSQDRTGCDTVEITATPVNASGTPNVTDPAYTFVISDAGGTAMTPTIIGTAIYTVTVPAAGTDTYTVTIQDANGCPNTRTIDITPQEQLVASVATDAICLNAADANAVITITSGTSPFTYVRTNTGTGNTISTNITNTSFPIEVDNAITQSGTYEYVITDAFGCTSAAFPVTIEDELTLSIIPVPASTVCDVLNNPESSEYQLTVGGGNGAYTYEVAIGETAINTNNFVSYTGPNYTVDPSQEGERFVFRVSDGLSCTVIDEPALITFPTFPEVTFSNIEDIECPAANGSALLTVTSGTGKAPYEIFVTETGNAFPTTALAGNPLAGITYTTAVEGVFDFKVVDDNGCESTIGQFAISNSVITLRNFDIQDITCTSAMVVDNSGSISLSVSNSEIPVEFVLFDALDTVNSLTETTSPSYDSSITISNPTTDAVIFGMLTARDYIIEVTDANGCTTPFEFEATVNTNSDIVIGDYQVIDEDCILGGTGITIAFPVDGIGTILLEHPIDGGGLVNATTLGDRIFKYDDATDPFPNTTPPVTLGADDIFYVVTGLSADTDYTIIAEDGSGCQEQRIFRTPANDEIVNLTADTVPESICITNDGEIAVNFEIGTSTAASFDVYLYEDDDLTIATTGTANPFTVATINAGITPEHTFTNLIANNYIVRVTENGESPLCGNPIEVEVETAPDLILDTPSFGEANCQNNFIVPVTASAKFGVLPYEYAIVQGTLAIAPVGTLFNTSNVLSADTNTGADLNWTVFVRDASGCERPQEITIDFIENPDFEIDPEFSVDQCENAVASYTVTGQIINYNASLEPYTYTLDGSAITPTSAIAGSLTFEVPNRGTYIIEVFDKNGCDDNDNDEITIYDLLEVTASLGDVDCNGDVTTITANVIGGYNEPTRSLDYIVYAANDLSFATPIVSLIGTMDTAPIINVTGLLPNTDYVVVVTDNFSTATSCSDTSNVVSFEEIEKSSIKATPQDVSCNGATDGILLIEDITVGEIPVTYELYSYANAIDAADAFANNAPLTGIDVTTTNVNTSNERLFENLPVGFYVAFVRNGSIACYTASENVEIAEPALFTGAGLTATAIQADCATPTQPGVEISITVTGLDGEAPYFYRIPGVIENFTEITDITSDNAFNAVGVFNSNTSYSVEFTDASGVACVPAIPIAVTIDPFTANPNLDLSQTTPFSCSTDEEVTLEITNVVGLESYTFTNTLAVDLDGNALTALATTATTATTANFVITESGRYVFQATSTLGCESNEFEYIVRELDQLRVEATGSIVECFGDTNTISFEVLDYTGDYTYTYSFEDDATNTVITSPISAVINTSTGPVIIPALDVNTYTINVTAGTAATCQNTAIAQIIGPDDAVTITSADAITDITCLVDYAEVQIIADGGFGNYEYEISGGTLGAPVNNTTGFFDLTSQIGAGTYTISVIDVDNPSCTAATTTLPIVAPVGPQLIQNLGPFEILCFGGNTDITVSLDLSMSTPTANVDDLRYSLYTYNTTTNTRESARVVNQAPNNSGDTFVVFTGIEAGDYLAEVSDIFGCVHDIKPIVVSEPLLLELSANVTNAFSCDNLDMEVWTAIATGGTPGVGYSYTILSETDTQSNAVTSNLATEPTDGIFNISPFRILTIQVTDGNGCTASTVIETGKTIDPIEFDIISNPDKICATNPDGTPGTDGFVELVNVIGGEGNYVYTVYEADGTTIYVDPNGIPAQKNIDLFFNGLIAGNYVFEVSSNNCAVVTKPFSIEESPEIITVDNAIPVSCRGADDGVISITIDDTLDPFDTPVSFSLTLTSDNGSPTAAFTIDNINEPAEFDGLAPGMYTWTIINNNSIGCLITGTTTINDKTDITVDNGIFDNINIIQTGGLCRGIDDGAIQMYVNGGTRTAVSAANPSGSYYYQIRTDFSTDPDINAIKTTGNELVYVSTDTNGDLFEVIELFDNDVAYEIVIIDEGNELSGDDFRACTNIQSFIFNTENFDDFDVRTTPNCTTLGYTIDVTNRTVFEFPDNLRIYVYNTDGSLAATGGPRLEDVEVAPGEYTVQIGNEVTGCQSVTPIILDELEDFEPVQFVEINEAGDPVQPFAATNNINVYQLQVTGGTDPTAAEPYRFEAMFTDQNGNVEIIELDSDGTFEISETGFYMFTVYDDVADDGNGCFDVSSTIGLNFIAIDIPNVFNPTSNDGFTNTWYPDNLTTDFTRPGINSPLIDDGNPNTPPIPAVFQNTGGVVTGGTTIDGTTTGGYTINGTLSTSTSTETVASTPPGTASTTYVTTGGTTTDGVTTGGLTIETTTETDGTVTVRVIKGGTLTGGTPGTGGVITGGTLNQTGASIMESFTANTSGGSTTFNITTQGSTTGGATTGGTTSGGVTLGDTTTGGTTFGATTEDGITIGGITTVISIGPGGTTVETFTNTTITGGTTKDGTTTGGITEGGSISGGVEQQIGVEFLDFENIEVLIFDRYGRMLADFTGILEKGSGGQGWDGTYQGKQMPSGDYWYIIKLNDSQGREFTGHFTLYRR